MVKLKLRQQAIYDISDIWAYTVYKWSEKQADKYYKSIKAAHKEIENNPNIGKLYEEIESDLFGYKVGKHIIFYHKIDDNTYEVVRILHEQMDLKKQLIN